MKSLKRFNQSSLKLARGMAGIFVLKFFIITFVFVFQSCQIGSDIEPEEMSTAKNNFISSFKQASLKINSVKFNQAGTQTHGTSYYQDETQNIYVYSDDPYSTLDETDEFSELLDGPYELLVNPEEGGGSTGYVSYLGVISVPVDPVEEALAPSIDEAKAYLYSRGYTDSVIQELLAADEYGVTASEHDLVPTVALLIAEEQNQLLSASYNLNSVFATSAHASEIGQCAGDALGVSAIAAVVAQGLATDVGKALLKQAIRKVATRAMGWVGAAIFTYEFGDCMNWW